jgi:tRNA pseudouridine32 synthase/23S rRNA pseudouridine746 synthase
LELGLSPPLPTRDGVGASCIALPSVNEFARGATSSLPTNLINAETDQHSAENIFPNSTHAENSLNAAADQYNGVNLFSPGTIAHFLAHQFPVISAHEWSHRIAAGNVVDEHGVAVTPTRAFEAGLRIYYYRALETEPRIPFDEVILFQDEQLVVVDKPHFLPVIPSGRYLQETLLVRLKRKLGIDTLVPIHRIDRGTAGVIVFSVQESTRGKYQQLFATRDVRKTYEAVALINHALHFPLTHASCLAPDEHFMRMKEVPGEANSQTHFEIIRELTAPCTNQLSPTPTRTVASPPTPTPSHALASTLTPVFALYRLRPITGRKHQLRVHCAALEIPIVNDPMYPTFLPEPARDAPEDFSKPLQLLARTVEFTDPITGAARTFTSARQLEFLVTHI